MPRPDGRGTGASGRPVADRKYGAWSCPSDAPLEAGRRGLRRWAAVALAVVSLTTLLVFVPAPHWAIAEEVGVRTVHVDLARSTVDRSSQAVATEGLDATEAQQLLAARRDRVPAHHRRAVDGRAGASV